MYGTFPAGTPTVPSELKSALERAGPESQVNPDAPVEPYTVYAAAAAEVLRDAIGRSDGSREDVIEQLFGTDLETFVGQMRFDGNGDPRNAATTGYLVYVAGDGAWRLSRRALKLAPSWPSDHGARSKSVPQTRPGT